MIHSLFVKNIIMSGAPFELKDKDQVFELISGELPGFDTWVRERIAVAISKEVMSCFGESGFLAIVSCPAGFNHVTLNQSQRNMYSGKMDIPSEATRYALSLLDFE